MNDEFSLAQMTEFSTWMSVIRYNFRKKTTNLKKSFKVLILGPKMTYLFHIGQN